MGSLTLGTLLGDGLGRQAGVRFIRLPGFLHGLLFPSRNFWVVMLGLLFSTGGERYDMAFAEGESCGCPPGPTACFRTSIAHSAQPESLVTMPDYERWKVRRLRRSFSPVITDWRVCMQTTTQSIPSRVVSGDAGLSRFEGTTFEWDFSVTTECVACGSSTMYSI